MKHRYNIISIILAVAVIAGLFYLGYSSRIQPLGTPILLYNYSFYQNGNVVDVINASQGTTQQFNLTLTSINGAPEIAVPIENLTLKAYNSTIDYSGNWDTSGWNTSVAQESVFNYTFSQSQTTLLPNISNSTTLTIQWANNAPTGRYSLEINVGSFEFLSTPEKYDKPYGSTIWIGAVVAPNSQSENLQERPDV